MTTQNPKSTSAAPADDDASTGATSADITEAALPAEDSASSSDAGSGIKSRMSEAQRAMLASKSRGGGGQAQSVGKSHQPTQASGKKGPVEKKTRW